MPVMGIYTYVEINLTETYRSYFLKNTQAVTNTLETHARMESLNKKIGNIKKNSVQILELKSTKLIIKILLDQLNNKMEMKD